MTITSQTTHNNRSTWIGREGVAVLAPKVSGDLLRPGDDAFDAATELWNGTIRRRPALIVRPVSTDEVSAAVRFAARVGAPVAVRSGGHNVAGFAMCDDGVVIDLSAMNSVNVDAERRLARAGGGATWGDLDRATQPHGLAAPGGLVSKTGIGGLTLGGGLGWMRRQHGLSCDNLALVEIVTADGEIRRASEEENPDLLSQIPSDEEICSVTADSAYDPRNCRDATADRRAAVFGHSFGPVAVMPSLPPRKNARPWKPTTAGAIARNEALRASKYLGRAIWRNWSGYHRQGPSPNCHHERLYRARHTRHENRGANVSGERECPFSDGFVQKNLVI